MALQNIVDDVKTRVETLGQEAQNRYHKLSKQAQDVVKTSTDTAKKAGDLVSKNAKKVAQTNQGAARQVLESTRVSITKAREAGIKEVAAKPVEFLPQGKDPVVKAYQDTVTTLGKTRTDLSKLLKKSADQIRVTLQGKPVAKKAAPAKRKVATTARKATTAATASVTPAA